jgi:hypothetical protein
VLCAVPPVLELPMLLDFPPLPPLLDWPPVSEPPFPPKLSVDVVVDECPAAPPEPLEIVQEPSQSELTQKFSELQYNPFGHRSSFWSHLSAQFSGFAALQPKVENAMTATPMAPIVVKPWFPCLRDRFGRTFWGPMRGLTKLIEWKDDARAECRIDF